MKAFAVQHGANHERLAGRILCHDVRAHRHEIVFRKGHALRDEDLALLLAQASPAISQHARGPE